MSLIFEALKKLERERDTSGPGFLVLAPTPWPATRARLARVALVALLAGAVAGASAWGVWKLLGRDESARAAVPSAPASAPPLATAALPPPIWDSSRAPRATPAAGQAPSVRGAAPKPSVAPAPASPAPPPPPLRLEAISSQDGQPVAVINGQLVRKGETVEGALVVWIGADSVEVEVQGRRRVIGF